MKNSIITAFLTYLSTRTKVVKTDAVNGLSLLLINAPVEWDSKKLDTDTWHEYQDILIARQGNNSRQTVVYSHIPYKRHPAITAVRSALTRHSVKWASQWLASLSRNCDAIILRPAAAKCSQGD